VTLKPERFAEVCTADLDPAHAARRHAAQPAAVTNLIPEALRAVSPSTDAVTS